jgi:hypothetical protein
MYRMKKRTVLGSVALSLLLSSTSHSQTLPAYLAPANLISWYPFTGNANDSSGVLHNNGVVSGATLTTNRFGIANAAYSFDGINSYILCPDTSFPANNDPRSVVLFYKARHFSNLCPDKAQLCFYGTYNTGQGYSLTHLDTCVGPLNFKKVAFSGWSNPYDVNGPQINDSAWHFLANTYDGSISRLYYDNVLQDSNTFTLSTALNGQFSIGRLQGPLGASNQLDGAIDDIAIYNRVLTTCEMTRIYKSAAFLFITGQPTNHTAAVGSTATFTVTDTGTGNTHQWQVNSGSGYTNLTSTAPYSGVTTSTLTITGVTVSLTNNKYRCVVTGIAGCVDTSSFGKLTVGNTSTTQLSSDARIVLMPNPTTGYIAFTGVDNAEIRVYNAIGQMVKSAPSATHINIDDLAAGLYSVKLFDNTGTLIFYDKVVKQ